MTAERGHVAAARPRRAVDLRQRFGEKGKRVLVLERGKHVALRESFGAIASMIDQIKIEGSGVAAARGVAVGGSTGVYFAVVA